VPVRDPLGRPDLEFVGSRNVVSLTDLRIKKSQSIDDNIRRKHEFSVTEAHTDFRIFCILRLSGFKPAAIGYYFSDYDQSTG